MRRIKQGARLLHLPHASGVPESRQPNGECRSLDDASFIYVPVSGKDVRERASRDGRSIDMGACGAFGRPSISHDLCYTRRGLLGIQTSATAGPTDLAPVGEG